MFPIALGNGGGEEGEESWIIVRYVQGDITIDRENERWRQAIEIDLESSFDHELDVLALNNGTDIFFLLSWDDSTQSTGRRIEFSDGVAIRFEGEEENPWVWSTGRIDIMHDPQVFSNAEWTDGKWFVTIGRRLMAEEGVKLSVSMEFHDFIAFAVWDGAEGEALEQIGDDIKHSDFIILPYIEVQPKDVFFWAALIIFGAVSFLGVELRLQRRIRPSGES